MTTRYAALIIILFTAWFVVPTCVYAGRSNNVPGPVADCEYIYVFPSETIPVEPTEQGVMTLAQLQMRSNATLSAGQQAKLELWSGDTKIEEAQEPLKNVRGGLALVFISDINPRYLAITQVGDATYGPAVRYDPRYYIGVLWESVLGQFQFSSDDVSDSGMVLSPTPFKQSPPSNDKGELYNYLTQLLPQIAQQDSTTMRADFKNNIVQLLDAEKDPHRIIVVFRWENLPFVRDENYAQVQQKLAVRGGHLLVVDIGQDTDYSEEATIGQARLSVIALGPTPERYPTPFDPNWELAQQNLRQQITRRVGSKIEQMADPLRQRFEFKHTWQQLIMGEQASAMTLRVSAMLSDGTETACSRSLRFPDKPNDDAQTRRLEILWAVILVSSIVTVMPVAYLAACWLPLLVGWVLVKLKPYGLLK